MLEGKKVLIGITAGIAAYKVLELIRLFKKQGAGVKVVVTPNAFEFVTETTLQSLSQNKVYFEQYKIDDYKPEHIELADSDIFVIAPCSANTIGKIANGIADNLLTSIACAFKNKIIIAPAMNTGMWGNGFVQENIQKLKNAGIEVLDVEDGFLACGDIGAGRLLDINVIFEKAKDILLSTEKKNLKGKRIVITAGGTKEDIDPVRYIGNYSSGKMGLAVADIAFEQGADVIFVTTVEVQRPYKTIKVKSASDMFESVKQEFKTADSLIMAAAVADFRVQNKEENKIKKQDTDTLTLNLVKNPDILAEMVKIKSENQIVVGFCAESQNLLENAKSKILKKGCDFIVANDISKSDVGFSSDYNEVYILNKNGKISHIEKNTKKYIAQKILEEIYG